MVQRELERDLSFDVFREVESVFSRLFLALYGFATCPLVGAFGVVLSAIEYAASKYRMLRWAVPTTRSVQLTAKSARALLQAAQLNLFIVLAVWVCTVPTGTRFHLPHV